MSEQQKHLQTLSDQYQDLQTSLQSSIETSQRLEAQQQENQAVQKEFSDLSEDANIYKLIGPVLVKQDKSEAVMAVDARLSYIEKEISRVEKQITEIQANSEKKKNEIMQLQVQSQPSDQT